MYFVKTTHYGQLHLNKRQKLILNQHHQQQLGLFTSKQRYWSN